MTGEILNIEIAPDAPAPKLTIPQAAALGELVPNEHNNRRTDTGPRLPSDRAFM